MGYYFRAQDDFEKSAGLSEVPLEELFDASEQMDETSNDVDDNMKETNPKSKRNSASTRQKWTKEEEEKIKQIFQKCFVEKKTYTKTVPESNFDKQKKRRVNLFKKKRCS